MHGSSQSSLVFLYSKKDFGSLVFVVENPQLMALAAKEAGDFK